MRIGNIERVAFLDHVPALFTECIACVVRKRFVIQFVTLFPKNVIKKDVAHVVDAFLVHHA